MPMTPPPGGYLQFSTDGMSEREAILYWREMYGKFILKLDVNPVNDQPFRQTTRLQAFPRLSVAYGATSGISVRRTKALVADGNDDFLFMVNLSGQSTISHSSHELDLGPRQATLISNADVGSGTFPATMRYLTIGVPRNALAERIGNPENALLRPVAESNDALRLLIDYVTMTIDAHSPLNPSLKPAFETHVHDLIGLALGATHEGRMVAQGRGVRAARLNTIKADIMTHLHEEGLSVHDVARRHGVTPRYVQLLFDDAGQTFSEFVIERRLAKAHRMLADPAYAEWTISAIAFEVGFSNLSWFNRTFRRKYGASPSDIRRAEGSGG
jgi:AraC-like DNA-binding protein